MLLRTVLLLFTIHGFTNDVLAQQDHPTPIRALLIAGGCCHDYAQQQQAICEGIQQRANVRVDVYWTDNSSTSPVFPLYRQLNWAEDYDVIIHDECGADIKDPAILNRIVQTHQKLPSVHLHCAMHSFRTGTDAWFKHLGLQSSGHGPQEPIDIEFVDRQHPITETLEDWTTIREELYNNVKVLGAHPLAVGRQKIGGDNPRTDKAIVAWINESQGARSFSTTIGHNTETVRDARYLELVTRGLLWSCGKLTPEYLVPYQGDHEVTFIDKQKHPSVPSLELGTRPANATLVKATASSTQNGHPAHHAIDADRNTRWCANGSGYPQWLRLEFDGPARLSGIRIVWEFPDRVYRYVVEGSEDGKDWKPLVDKSENQGRSLSFDRFEATSPMRFIRVRGLGSGGGWCSVREVEVKGHEIGPLWPADPKSKNGEFLPLQEDPYGRQGNLPPRIERLSDQEEAAILKDVQVAEGFDVTLFASPPAVNYPVFVSASVDGTVYVSSDGNGSLGRDPRRGRVIRLRDLDGDGRADETKVFCEVDAPRGLVWDRDRLYLMHPPNLSVFFDHDGDGVADEQRTLVKNLAFGYDQRPADHTTNGVTLGPDGWLYVAGGDFGFIDAVGRDGRTLTHRGGGVIRVRTDGTGLEVYSTGTRNILEVAISPEMEMFARDNTNDGGGWNVRLHHFTGGEDHGYPRLYKNFADECVEPLADYGGGSGCGAVYIDEPGFSRWNRAPFTADWGTGSLYRHTVQPRGASFQESASPESFIKMTRPTDADVDGNSRVYCASWKGATFNWNGPNVGYVVCVKPSGYSAPPMPSYATLSDEALVGQLDSQSFRRRMAAASELRHRGSSAPSDTLATRLAERSEERNLLDALQSAGSASLCLASLSHEDPLVVHTAVRALASQLAWEACFRELDREDAIGQPILRAVAMMHEPQVVGGLLGRLPKANRQRKRELLSALCRLHYQEGEWQGGSWGTRPDTRGPYYQPEAWGETDKIASALRAEIAAAEGQDAGFLIEELRRNRIELDGTLAKLLRLASGDDRMLAPAVMHLADAAEVPAEAAEVLIRAANDKHATKEQLLGVVQALTKLADARMPKSLVVSMGKLDAIGTANDERRLARQAIARSRVLASHTPLFIELSEQQKGAAGQWADAILLTVASAEGGSPEPKELARIAIDRAWEGAPRRTRLMEAAVASGNHYLDEKILASRNHPDQRIAASAKKAMAELKIEPKSVDKTPRIGTLKLADAVKQAVSRSGDAALGQQVFRKANCVACHAVSQSEIQKGPFLGNIAKTYKRPELATAVIEPSKTIAQGFATNTFLTSDGVVLTGFVTNELSDRVSIRDQQGKEITIMKDDIEQRKTSNVSVMPSGVMNDFTVHEMSSLLDYLQSLAP